MIPYPVLISIIIAITSFAFIVSAARYRMLDRSLKILCWLFLLTCLNEIAADFFSRKYKNNMPVYGVFGIIQFLLISLYFNYSIESFRKRNLGIYIGIAGAILGLVDFFFVQSPFTFNNYFLLTESILVVSMCLYSFYRILQSDNDMKLTSYVHFWITAILLFFWTATFLFWGLYDFLTKDIGVDIASLHLLHLIVNIMTYVGFGFVFIFYKKMQLINEQ